MKKISTPKKKVPVKPKATWIKILLTEQKEIDTLELIKKLTRMNVTSKAVYEALVNYPNVCKRADGLNDELQKVNREYEQINNKFETVQRAFKIINGVEPDDKCSNKNLISEECPDCGCDDNNFFMNVCSECGYNEI